ncbi:acyltransferase family protein [Nocardioides dongkuii]|uniref:acyltransferase family protein n=1 Tax=Nocardioides dongkuii TaxID=2760089 RepID=UPI0015FDEF57|nr:acyltransferase family protein [Nocardioides dongkuii]
MPAQRDPWFDNAKMALVTLVVLGHSWTLLPESRLHAHLYDFLYAWHVPAFVLVTGYLSRSFSYERHRLWQLVRTVAVPYLLFECALALFRVHVGGERLEDLFTDPHWPMWYLAALFFWRLLGPLFQRIPGAVPVAVATSLVAGLYAVDTLDLARVLGLLPFFVAGLLATPEQLARLRSRGAQAAGVLVLAGIWLATTWTDRWASTEWLYYRARYDELAVGDVEAFVIRAVVLAVGALGALAFLALVPRTGGWFSRMGAWTLVVYLFHGFAVLGAEYAEYPRWTADQGGLALLVTSAAAVGLALLLAWRPLATLLHHLVDPLGSAQRSVDRAVDVAVAEAETAVISEAIAGAALAAPGSAGQDPVPGR